jgi:hypothetical protein
VRGDPVRIIQRVLGALTVAGVAAVIVLAPGAAGSARSLAGTGFSSGAVTADSVVWDGVSS